MWSFLTGKMIGIGVAVAFLFSSFAYVKYKIEKLNEAENKIVMLIKENEKILADKEIQLQIKDTYITKLIEDFNFYRLSEDKKQKRDKDISKSLKTDIYTYDNVFKKINRGSK